MLLEKVKLSLRIRSDLLDLDILELIESAKADLSISGVKSLNEDDPLIIQAVKTYCKANFGLDNKDSEKYQRAYDNLKQHLSLCGDYNVEQ